MRRSVLALTFLLLTGCSFPTPSAPPPGPDQRNTDLEETASQSMTRPPTRDPKETEQFQKFLVEWLQNHGEKNVVTGPDGVGVAGNNTRIKASLYGSNQNEKGYVVEIEFRVKVSEKHTIIDFIAGMGDTEVAAINDGLVNYTLTSFHVIYKSFINGSDPHQDVEEITHAGRQRELAMGDLYMRSAKGIDPVDLDALRQQLRDAIVSFPLATGPHWIKVVYGQMNDEPSTVEVTMDNESHRDLTNAILKLDWPKRKLFYMVKVFIVIK